MKTSKEACLNKIAKLRLLYIYKDRNKTIKQVYTVDLSKIEKIGGLGSEGYGLIFYPENKKSNTVITYTDLLYLLRGEEIKNESFTVLAL